METKDIPIKWRGHDEVVTIKKIGWKDYNNIQRKSMKFKMIGSLVQSDMDPITMKELIFIEGIEKAPFDMSDASLKELGISVGDMIYAEIQDFSEIGEKKNNIEVQSKTEQEA